jgi:hypothetical protein
MNSRNANSGNGNTNANDTATKSSAGPLLCGNSANYNFVEGVIGKFQLVSIYSYSLVFFFDLLIN